MHVRFMQPVKCDFVQQLQNLGHMYFCGLTIPRRNCNQQERNPGIAEIPSVFPLVINMVMIGDFPVLVLMCRYVHLYPLHHYR